MFIFCTGNAHENPFSRLPCLANLKCITAPAAEPVISEVEDSDTAPDTPSDMQIDEDFSLEKHLEAIEIEAIEKALEKTRWNKTAAARKPGISFHSLRYRLKNSAWTKLPNGLFTDSDGIYS